MMGALRTHTIRSAPKRQFVNYFLLSAKIQNAKD
jgi:hypothetical protein